MANEEKARSEGKVVADKMKQYVSFADLDEKTIGEQFHTYTCDLKCSTAKRDSSTKIIRATVKIGPGLELLIRDLSVAEYSLIMLERKISTVYQGVGIHLPVMVRFSKGLYENSDEFYSRCEVKLSKSVLKKIFLDYAQKKLIEISPELGKIEFVWDKNTVKKEEETLANKAELSGELFS